MRYQVVYKHIPIYSRAAYTLNRYNEKYDTLDPKTSETYKAPRIISILTESFNTVQNMPEYGLFMTSILSYKYIIKDSGLTQEDTDQRKPVL